MFEKCVKNTRKYKQNMVRLASKNTLLFQTAIVIFPEIPEFPFFFYAIEKSINTESTSYGVALLAAIGAGLISSLEKSSKNWKVKKYYQPQMSKNKIEKNRNGWQQAINKTIM